MDTVSERRIQDKKLGEVIVLDESPSMLQLCRIGDDSSFWYPKAKLQPVHEKPKKLRSIEKALLIEELSGSLKAGNPSISEFVDFLYTTDRAFYIRLSSTDLPAANNDYFEWTSGETIPEHALRISEDRKERFVAREWVLCFRHQLGRLYPFPVEPSGSMNGHPTRYQSPVGFSRDCFIYMRYASIIEQLVRAGLRFES